MSFPHGWGNGPDFESSAAKLRQERQEAAQMQHPVSAPTLSHEAIRDLMYAMSGPIKQHVAEQLAAHHPPLDPDEMARAVGPVIAEHVQACIDPLRTELASTAADNATLRSCVAALNTRCDEQAAEMAAMRAEIAAQRSTKTTGMHYCGVWKPDTTYEPDNVVTWEGGMFCAERQTALKPGSGASDDTGWRLCVRRGEPGASAFDIAKACGFRGSANEWIASLKPRANSGTAEPRK